MAWTYSGDPSTSRLDAYRFFLGDTLANEPVLQDEEINFIIDEPDLSENMIRYNLLMRITTTFARQIKRRLGPQTEDPTSRLNFFQNQLDHYRTLTSASGLSLPQYAYPKTFRKGMQSNPPYPIPPRLRGDYLV